MDRPLQCVHTDEVSFRLNTSDCLVVGCAIPPLGLNFKSASIECGDKYIREHREIKKFHQRIFLGSLKGGQDMCLVYCYYVFNYVHLRYIMELWVPMVTF